MPRYCIGEIIIEFSPRSEFGYPCGSSFISDRHKCYRDPKTGSRLKKPITRSIYDRIVKSKGKAAQSLYRDRESAIRSKRSEGAKGWKKSQTKENKPVELFQRQVAVGLLQAIKTEKGFELTIDGKVVVAQGNMRIEPIPNRPDWDLARRKGMVSIVFDGKNQKVLYAVNQKELDLIKDYQSELRAKKPKTIDDLIGDRKSLAQSVGSLSDAIIDKQAKYIDQGRSYPADVSAMERELKAKSKQLEDFDKSNPQVAKEIKQRKKAQVERFLEYD
jgi:hypothetical protein